MTGWEIVGIVVLAIVFVPFLLILAVALWWLVWELVKTLAGR